MTLPEWMSHSILPPEMHGGLMFTSGYKGLGKSYLASTADLPRYIAFLDFEAKGEGINRMVNFGAYHALTVEASRGNDVNPLHLYDATIKAIDALPQDTHTTLILDNVSPLEISMKAEALRNVDHYCKVFGLNKKNVLAGRFGGTSAVVNFLIAELTNRIHAKGVQLIVATSHISARWAGGVPLVNKYNVKGAAKWQELSILSLVLIPGDQPPVPSALVLKEQLGLIDIDRDPTPEMLDAMRRGEVGHTITRRLPTRLPLCNFASIRKYLYEPADVGKPADGEVPTPEEAKPFDERISREQITMVLEEQRRTRAALDEAEAELAGQLELQMQDYARDSDGTPVEVAKHLSAEFGVKVKPVQVVQWRK